MTSDNVTAQDKLDQMFNDGRINQQEYERLKRSLMNDREEVKGTSGETQSAKVPWQIWVVVVLLGLEGLNNLLLIPTIPIAAFWLAAKVVLILGLIKGWKWVFILALILCTIHTIFFALSAPIVALMNLVLLGLVASAWRFYFPGNNRISERI